jgi:hypothetical protein
MSFTNAKIVSKNTNPADYLKRDIERGNPKFEVSSGMLKSFLVCPRRWHRGYESPDSDAMRFGSLLDCRLLTPESFEARFSIKPHTYPAEPSKKGGEVVQKPFNANSTWCREWIEAQGEKEVVSSSEVAEIDTARKRMLDDEIIKAFLDESDRQIWVAAEWQDEDSGLLLPVKILVDLAPNTDGEFGKCLGDLKAIRSAALIPFQRQVYQLGWHLQAAFYQDVYVAATGEDRNTHCLLGVENYNPFEPFKRMLSQDFLQIGRQTYRHAMKRYARCLKSGIWPGYDDHADAIQGWSLTAAEPWMEFTALSDALEHEQESQLQNDDVPMP